MDVVDDAIPAAVPAPIPMEADTGEVTPKTQTGTISRLPKPSHSDSGDESSMHAEHKDLYFAIAKFLTAGPCKGAAKVLIRDMEQHGLMTKRIDWLGKEHDLEFEETEHRYPHVTASLLPSVCNIACNSASQSSTLPSRIPVTSILVPPPYNPHNLPTKREANNETSQAHNDALVQCVSEGAPRGPIGLNAHLVRCMQLGRPERCNLTRVGIYKNMHQLSQVMGHKAASYCILYDRTGMRIITGSDDCLVKVWSSKTGLLLATFRGHEGQVTDLAINAESTLLASSDTKGAIRVWSLATGAQVTTLLWHRPGAEIDTIQFSPAEDSGRRYLISTAKDCTVRCFRWWVDDSDPSAIPHFGEARDWNKYNISFDTRSSVQDPGKCRCRGECKCAVVCSDFSPGGVLFVTGATDAWLKVYLLDGFSKPRLCMQDNSHDETIECVKFDHTGTRILTGSKDGTARIWYHRPHWRLHSVVLKAVEGPNGTGKRVDLSFGCWTCDDSMVVCSLASDHSLNVWSTETHSLKHVLSRHEHMIISVINSPTDPTVVLSAAIDGRALLWDIVEGLCMREFVMTYTLDGSNQALDILDCQFAPDGRSFATVDGWGHWAQYGFQDAANYKNVPHSQFFHTDSKPVVRDALHFVLDQDSQSAPHIIPQLLVTNDGVSCPGYSDSGLSIQERLHLCSNLSRLEDTKAAQENLTRSEMTYHVDGKRPSLEAGLSFLTQKPSDSVEPDQQEVNDAKKSKSKVVRSSNTQPVTRTMQSSGRRAPTIRYLESSDEDPDFEEVSTSEPASDESEWEAASRRTQRSNARRSNRAKRRTERARNASMAEGSDVEDDYNEGYNSSPPKRSKSKAKQIPYSAYLPTRWLTMTEPLPTPYAPQIHDNVVYFRQGHAEYLQKIGSDSSTKQPWEKLSQLRAVEMCRVEDIEYVIGPPSNCVLRLSLVDNPNYPNETISVKYRDEDNILDFIVLKHRFDESARLDWKKGDRFQSCIDDEWYFGTVVERASLNLEFPGSPWRSIRVKWDPHESLNSDEADPEVTCPWELDPIDTSSSTTMNVNEMQISPAATSASDGQSSKSQKQSKVSYNPTEHIPDEEAARIAKVVMIIARLPISTAFRYPTETHGYFRKIPYPIDLKTIRLRLKSRFYRRIAALLWDIDRLCHCANVFDDAEVSHAAQTVAKALRATVDNPNASDPIAEHPELIEVWGDLLDSESEPESPDQIRQRVVAKDNQTVSQIAGNSALTKLWLKVNRKRISGLTANAKLIAGTVLYGPLADEIENGILSADDDDPSISRYRYIAEDNETPNQIALSIGCNIKRLLHINRPFFAGIVKSSKLEPGTQIRVPLRTTIPDGRKLDPSTYYRPAPRSSDSIETVQAGRNNGKRKRKSTTKRSVAIGLAVQDADWIVPARIFHFHLMSKPESYLLCDPVDFKEFPDYRDVIETPLDFETIRLRLYLGEYSTFDEYNEDVRLVLNNARTYNQGDDILIPQFDSLSNWFLDTCHRFDKVYRPSKGKFVGATSILETKNLQRALEKLHSEVMGQEDATWFNAAVDPNQVPGYREVITHPMDFGEISRRLSGNRYRSIKDYVKDMILVFSNACTFNEFGSAVYIAACTLYALFRGRLQALTGFNAFQTIGAGDTFDSEQRLTPALQQLIAESHSVFMGLEAVEPFAVPVPPAQVPTYCDIVYTPMDFGTIHSRLEAGRYLSIGQYLNDVYVVWSNARIFNEAGSDIYETSLFLAIDFCSSFVKSIGKYDDSNEAVPIPQFKVGENVNVLWEEDDSVELYEAVITSKNDTSITVQYIHSDESEIIAAYKVSSIVFPKTIKSTNEALSIRNDRESRRLIRQSRVRTKPVATVQKDDHDSDFNYHDDADDAELPSKSKRRRGGR